MTDMTSVLQDQVRVAADTGAGLNIVGAGTKTGLGRAAQGQRLVLLEHQGVISYSPTELVIQVRSGTTIAELNSILAEQKQRLVFDPPVFNDQATIGGSVAANQSGSSRPWSGGVRDSLLGVGLINGTGEHLQFGGQVMKNVAGFDVSRCQVGAMGTLGVITEVSLKVLPQYEADATLVFSASVGDALQMMPQYVQRNLPVTSVCYWQGKLYVRLQGSTAGVDSVVSAGAGSVLAQHAATALWHQLREYEFLPATTEQVLWRSNVAATDALVMCTDDCLLNWAGAQRWQLLPADQVGPEEAIQFMGGDRQGEVNGELNSVARLLQSRLKKAFDPHSVFNSGRLYSWM